MASAGLPVVSPSRMRRPLTACGETRVSAETGEAPR